MAVVRSTTNQRDLSNTNTQSNTRTNTTNVGFNSQFANESLTTQRLTPEQQAVLNLMLGNAVSFTQTNQANAQQIIDTLLASLQGGNLLTREQAIADTQGLLSGAMRTLQEGRLRELSTIAQGAGASQDALLALLGNDATARTAEAVARQQLDAIVNYVNAGTNQQAAASGALTQLLNSNPFQAVNDLLNTAINAQETRTRRATTQSSSIAQSASTSTTNSNTGTTRSSQANTINNLYTPYDAAVRAIGGY